VLHPEQVQGIRARQGAPRLPMSRS
jgi:hypothetical protein